MASRSTTVSSWPRASRHSASDRLDPDTPEDFAILVVEET
jgi:hypothetical protein